MVLRAAVTRFYLQQHALQHYKSVEYKAIMAHSSRWSETRPLPTDPMPAIQALTSGNVAPIADAIGPAASVAVESSRRFDLRRCPLLLGMPESTQLLPSTILTQARPASMKWAYFVVAAVVVVVLVVVRVVIAVVVAVVIVFNIFCF